MARTLLALALCSAVSACSVSHEELPDGARFDSARFDGARIDPDVPCDPGSSRTCRCLGRSCDSMQICLPDGTGWYPCAPCGPPCDSGPAPDADRYDPWACATASDAGVDAAVGACALGVLSWSTAVGTDTGQIHSIWGSSAEDVWAVGESGASPTTALVLHGDASGWSPVETPARSALHAVWGSGPNDVWAGGERELLHFDGTSWEVRTFFFTDHIDAIWGSCDGGVWVGSASWDTLEHDDGTHWTSVPASPPAPEPGANVTSIFGFGADDIWAVGVTAPPIFRTAGLSFSPGWRIRHWNGVAFADIDVPHGTNAIAPRPLVWGATPNDVWIAGDSLYSGPLAAWTLTPLLHHWDGSDWTAVTLPGPTNWDRALVALWGTAANDVWTRDTSGQLFHFDGSTWTADADPASHGGGEAGWSADPCHVFTGGSGGIIEGVPP